MEITFIAHSGFFIKNQQGNFLIDPFIKNNPNAIFCVNDKKIDAIFLTHGHSDHLGDAVEISKSKNAPIYAIFELANYCIKKGAKAIGAGVGGKIESRFDAIFLPAIHSSSTSDGIYAGNAASVLVDGIFHAGDSALTIEYKIIGEIYKPEIAILPIGGHFTMGINEAVIAAKWLGAKIIIPMHYNTFEAIQAPVEDFKKKIEAQGQKCLILNPGETFSIEDI